MTPPPLEISALVKAYGDRRALDGVDLVVARGSVFGFLGANGAGKTTTLRIVLGLARADAGAVRIFGDAPGSAQARAQVGFCPDVPGFLPWMTAREVMEHTAQVFGLDTATTRRRTGELLELAGLAGTPSRVGGYSRGMRQRLGLAQALVNAPRLLLLDEPTSALDPLGRRAVLDLLTELRGRTTVFFSTHLLPDVERVCDTVAILDQGRVVAAGPTAQVRAAHTGAGGRVVVEVDDAARLRGVLAGQAWVTAVEDGAMPGSLMVSVTDLDEAAARLPAEVVTLGLRLHRLEPREASLEDAFVGLVGAAR